MTDDRHYSPMPLSGVLLSLSAQVSVACQQGRPHSSAQFVGNTWCYTAKHRRQQWAIITHAIKIIKTKN